MQRGCSVHVVHPFQACQCRLAGVLCIPTWTLLGSSLGKVMISLKLDRIHPRIDGKIVLHGLPTRFCNGR